MDTTKLRAIQEDKANRAQSSQRHDDIVTATAQVGDNVLFATTSLIKYLEHKTTKTEIVNQLKEIGTPDALKVVEAVNALHDTLKTHENTDLSQVTEVMQAILDEAKQIPKELPEAKEAPFVDYTAQFTHLSDAIKAVEQVVKEQKLIAEAPIINVPETQVNVDAPDLAPLQGSITAVVEAVKGIVIPEYKTDNLAVEKLLKASNTLLKGILEKPVGGGGGGGGRATPYQDSAGQPAFVTVNQGSLPVSDVALAKRVDTTVANTIYVGSSAIGTSPSSATWQIKRIDTTTGADITWADGDSAYDNIWDNRASLSYS